MNIIFLYSELVGYTEGTLKAILAFDTRIKIDVVYWDKKNTSPYQLEKDTRINFYGRSSLDKYQLVSFINERSPDIVYVSGWMDKGYIYALHKYKSITKNVKVVCGIDDQWHGSLRQHIGRIVFKVYFKYIFDYMWVTGKPQYYYAKKMGYPNSKIIYDCYSADTDYFYNKVHFSQRLVYLGRFLESKGTLRLVECYEKLPTSIKSKWPLYLIGAGPDEDKIKNIKSDFVKIVGFLQGNELIEEISKGGVFCAPSFKEQWGVAIHEMALKGYPLLLSDVCGAATEFLINGYNGFSFDVKSDESFFNALEKMTSLSHDTLTLFGERSHQLGQRINSEMSAASLLSILE